MRTRSSAALAVLCLGLIPPPTRAELHAYNGFDYASGGSSGIPLNHGDTLVGWDPATKSLGSVNMAGTSAGAVAAGQGGLSNVFQTTGLTFGTLHVRGGSARYDNDLGQPAYLSFNYSGNTLPAGSTIYTSHLVRILVAKTQGSVVSLRINTSKTGGSGTAFFNAYADTGNTTDSKTGVQYGTGNANTANAGPPLAENTTYLVIGRFTNAGMTTGSRTATVFVLNEAQFAHHVAGGFGEAEWESATLGTAPDQIVSRATDTYTGSSSFNLVHNGGIQAGIGNAGANGGLGQDVLYDEIRVGSTLADVTPAGPPPEPALITLETVDAIATEPTAASPAIGRVRIRRLDASTHAASVQLAVSGTATAGLDYHPIPSTVTLPENTDSAILEIRPIGDRRTEPDETVTLTLQAGNGYLVDGTGAATVTIQDGPFIDAPTQLINNLAAGIPQKIVVFGTSLTASGAWTSQMKAALDTAYPGLVTLENGAGSGRNSKWGLANLPAQVISREPDTVFIEFAVNDAVARPTYQDLIHPAQARANLNAIIDGIQSALPDCEIILQVMNPVVDTASNNDGATARPHLALCQQTYRDVAKERGLLLIDHMPAWQSVLDQGTSAFLQVASDGLHPGDTGYALYVTPVILRELGLHHHLSPGLVMLHADNHRAAEPLDSETPARRTRITVSRNSVFADQPLTVPLTYGGTAGNGVDFAALPSSVTIPAGAASASVEVIPLTDAAAEGLETFTVSAAASPGFTLASPSKAATLIEDLPFDDWRKNRFTPAELADPLVSGDNADPDGDGIPNLIEFFTNRLPKSPDPGGAITRGTETLSGTDHFTITYDRLPASKLTAIPQTSSDLDDWKDGPAFVEETVLADDGLIQTIRARSLAPLHGREFMRIKVVRRP